MDQTHLILGGMLLLGIVFAVIFGVWAYVKTARRQEETTRRQEIDQAVDAATFLALRDLRQWLERNRAEQSR
jgi:hypothetical protein